MKRQVLILLLFSLAIVATVADDFVDDIYYSTKQELQRKLKQPDAVLKPRYSKNVKEIVFIEDSAVVQPADTVKAIVKYQETLAQ